jgi:WD40 repeat protein
MGSGHLVTTLVGHTDGVWAVSLSADGEVVGSASFDGSVRLWEVTTGRQLATMRGHDGGVWGVALSADARLVASGGVDGTVRTWNASSGALLRTLRGDRRYERLDITGLTGVTEAQRQAMLALGAVSSRSPAPPGW